MDHQSNWAKTHFCNFLADFCKMSILLSGLPSALFLIDFISKWVSMPTLILQCQMTTCNMTRVILKDSHQEKWIFKTNLHDPFWSCLHTQSIVDWLLNWWQTLWRSKIVFWNSIKNKSKNFFSFSKMVSLNPFRGCYTITKSFPLGYLQLD